jgi:hypothetical protein
MEHLKAEEKRTESSIVGADIYLCDKRREDLDARIHAWINEPEHQDISTRLGTQEEREERSMLHIWSGGIDETSKALAKEYQQLKETHYFRDSYNDTSLFWMFGMSWWHLSENGAIDDNGIMRGEDIRLLLEHYYETKDEILSDSAIQKWFNDRSENGQMSKDETWETVAEYFRAKGDHFEQFCKRTLENDGHWECSV